MTLEVNPTVHETVVERHVTNYDVHTNVVGEGTNINQNLTDATFMAATHPIDVGAELSLIFAGL